VLTLSSSGCDQSGPHVTVALWILCFCLARWAACFMKELRPESYNLLRIPKFAMGLSPGLVIGFGLLAAVAVYGTWPGADSLDYSSCEPKVGSQLSAKIYGRFFWEQALTRASELADMKTTETILADAERQARQNDQRLEEFYAKNPSIAPTPAERTAQRLRERADRIEAQDGLNRIFTMEREMKTKALNCVQVITQKLRTM
jgi:hypothetical protein